MSESMVNVKNIRKPGYRKRRINLIITIVIFIVILFLAYLYITPKKEVTVLKDYKSDLVKWGDIDKRINVVGSFRLINNDLVITTEDAICTDVLKKSGDFVYKGEEILVMESSKLLDEKRDLENQLEQVKRNNLKSAQDYRRSVRNLNRKLEKSAKIVDKSLEEFKDTENLYNLGSITKKELEDSKDNYTLKKEEYKLVLLDLSDLEEDRKLEQELLNFDLKSVENQLSKINKRIDSLTIKASMDGTVLEYKVKKGERLLSGDSLLQIGNLDNPYIEAYIPVKYSDNLFPNIPVVINYDNKKLNGSLKLINSIATSGSNGEKLLYSEIEIHDLIESYIPNSSVSCEVIISKEEKVLVIPRGEFLVSGKNRYVYKIEGDKAVKTEVRYGTVNSSSASISQGLEAGDKIITSSYNEFINEDIIYLK